MAQSDRFYFWRGYYDALTMLDEPVQVERFIKGMCAYAFDGEVPDFSDDKVLLVVWQIVRDQVAESVNIGREMSERGRRGGKASGKTRSSGSSGASSSASDTPEEGDGSSGSSTASSSGSSSGSSEGKGTERKGSDRPSLNREGPASLPSANAGKLSGRPEYVGDLGHGAKDIYRLSDGQLIDRRGYRYDETGMLVSPPIAPQEEIDRLFDGE